MNQGFSIQEWHYEQTKGKIRSYVAREREPFPKVAKTVFALRKTGRSSSVQIERMFQEVFSESVQPFLGPPYHQPCRSSGPRKSSCGNSLAGPGGESTPFLVPGAWPVR